VRISQKLEYACRALAQLAKNFDGQTITRLDEIAQREAVSANFLVQILNDLRKSGLINSKRGKMGGYLLAKPAKSITLYEIVNSVEPTLIDKTMSSNGESGESVSKIWRTVSSDFSNNLRQVTLEDMLPEEESGMFYI